MRREAIIAMILAMTVAWTAKAQETKGTDCLK